MMGPLPGAQVASALTRAARAFADRPPVGRTPHDVVLAENKYRLLRFRRPGDAPAQGAPVLLVPSLINKWYVLDLLPDQSFVGFLLERGHDVFVIDWGRPGPEDQHLDLGHFVDRYLGRCVRTAARLSGHEQVHILGYCLGGTLTAIHAALFPERVASMVTLAAPIGFHDEGLLTRWMRIPTFNLDALVDAFGNVPWPIMQASFYMLKPMLQVSKLRTLIDRANDDDWLRVFAAIETWGNDNVSFPGAAFRTYIRALYQENRLVNGGLSVAGRAVRLEALRCPLMVVSFTGDHIVPEVSARCLLDLVGSEEKVDVLQPGGHVGAVIGKRARSGLWTQISDFYRAHDAPRRA
jgi:polyhydroxyalkanoate synthase